MSLELDEQYPYIRAWNEMLQATNSYTMEQQEVAKATNAPKEAVFYQGKTNSWETASNIKLSEKKEWILKRGEEIYVAAQKGLRGSESDRIASEQRTSEEDTKEK